MFGFKLMKKTDLFDEYNTVLEIEEEVDKLFTIIDEKDSEIEWLRRIVETKNKEIGELLVDYHIDQCTMDFQDKLLEDAVRCAEIADIDLEYRNTIITTLQNKLVDQEEAIREEMLLNLKGQGYA